jgi:hypothetical protein
MKTPLFPVSCAQAKWIISLTIKMPADRVERKKKTKTPGDVPELGDPERKRVLNVLAQRRYRKCSVL